MRRLPWAVAGGLAVAMGMTPMAAATAEIEHLNVQKTVVISGDNWVPCIDRTGVITLTINGVQHYVTTENGTHERVILTGTYDAVLDGGGTSSGRVTAVTAGNYQGSGDLAVFTEAWSGRITAGVGAGISWNGVLHYTGPEDQIENGLDFDRLNCH